MKLKDVLRQYDEQSLYFYARDLGIQAAKDILPEQLCQTMVERILNDHHIEKRLSILDDQTYQVVLQVLSDEEIEEKLKKFRAFLLVNMIDGKVSYYCSNFEKVKFEENKVYVPEKFIKYLDTIVDESNTFIGASNYRNQLINGLNAIDVIVIKALKEPTTKKNLLEALKDVPIYRHTDEGSFEVPAEEYLEEALKKFENLHYFVKK